MRLFFVLFLSIFGSSIAWVESLQPVARYPVLNKSFFRSSGYQVLLHRWIETNNQYVSQFLLFDARAVNHIDNAFFSLDALSLQDARYFGETIYALKDRDGIEQALYVYNVSNPAQPILIQTIAGIKHIPFIGPQWAIIDYPTEPIALYRRDERGLLTFEKSLDLTHKFVPSYFPWDENTFFGIDYGSIPLEVTISPEGNFSTRLCPVGFPPYVGFSVCQPFISNYARMGDGLAITTSMTCVDVISDDIVPDQVDVPITWEPPLGALVFVDRLEEATPTVSMPDVNVKSNPEDLYTEFHSAEGIAIYHEFIALIQLDQLRIWKRIGNEVELIQRIIDPIYFSVAISGDWLLASGYHGLDLFDLTMLKTDVYDWQLQ